MGRLRTPPRGGQRGPAAQTRFRQALLASQSSDVLTFPARHRRRSVECVPSYLVETYLARSREADRAASEQRARSAAEDLTRGRTRVRFDHSIHVPTDELCLYVFEATSNGAVALVAERAGLDPIRIVEVSTGGAVARGNR